VRQCRVDALGAKAGRRYTCVAKGCPGPRRVARGRLRHFTGRTLDDDVKGGMREVRSARSRAGRVG